MQARKRHGHGGKGGPATPGHAIAKAKPARQPQGQSEWVATHPYLVLNLEHLMQGPLSGAGLGVVVAALVLATGALWQWAGAPRWSQSRKAHNTYLPVSEG